MLRSRLLRAARRLAAPPPHELAAAWPCASSGSPPAGSAPRRRAWAGGGRDALALGAGGLALAAALTAAGCAEPPQSSISIAGTRRIVVAKDADLADGEMRQIKVNATPDGLGEGALLLARIDGKLYACGPSCSHYSAPLVQGVMAKDRMHVVCPWHDAAFDLRTGLPVRGPGLDAIPVYPVSVEDGNIVVEVPRMMEDFVAPPMAKRSAEDGRVFLILGGGAAGVAAADTLRQEGYAGRILMITEEPHLPYDRPVLSKNLGKAAEPASLFLREKEYFEKHDIEVRKSTVVKELDAGAKTVRLASGEVIKYDCALVATGARPRALPIPGGDLPNVLALRTPEDALKIAAACPAGKRVVVVGSSFIGMEAAATLQRRGCEVTVLGMESAPFERVLGKRIGDCLKALFLQKGVKFQGDTVVKEIQDGGSLRVVPKSGDPIVCDAVVVGVGVIPNADFVRGAEKARDGSLVTDEYLKCTAEGLFAAGDVAQYKSPLSGERQRVEHWDVATSQGRVAAKSMVGKPESFEQTPFFWTSLFGKNLRYVGYCSVFDELMVEGSLEKLVFVAYYCHKGTVKAVATMGRDPIAVAAGELMRMGKMPSVADLKAGLMKTEGLAAECKRLSCADAAPPVP